ncbi:MAG: radical SAM protein, partial [Nitrospirae bacterium]|nr:radical SAM protein [Nitrospirota bacterium]
DRFSLRDDLLVFVYTTECPLTCDYCCHPTEIYGRGVIETGKTVNIIKESIAIGSISRVIFTGGEPFLFYDDILGILREFPSSGMKFRIVTSAFWAENKEKTLSLLAPLQKAGLDELSISTDPSHQKFVPIEYVKNAVYAALSMGMTAEIASTFWRPGMDIRDTLCLDEHRNIKYVQGPVMPIGRARHVKSTWRDYCFEKPPSMAGGCREQGEGMDITIYPDGSVYPCCSGGFNVEAGLSAGNIYQEPLADIAERMWSDPFVRVMLGGGADMIYKLSRLRDPDVYKMLPDDSDMCTICQICVKIRRDKELMASLSPILDYGARILDAETALRTKAA